MNPDEATVLMLDLGRMVGHQQTELELPKGILSFFGLHGMHGNTSLNMRLSNGSLTGFRAIYRHDNGMWRIEFTDEIPEIRAGVFPYIDGVRQSRSDHAAAFTKITDGKSVTYHLRIFPVGSQEYATHLSNAAAVGNKRRTIRGVGGRNFGWY